MAGVWSLIALLFTCLHTSLLLLALDGVDMVRGAAPVPCSSFTVQESPSFFESVATCPACVEAGCGFCLSTLRCEEGTAAGPTSMGMSCPSWVFSQDDCPAIPDCEGLASCAECAAVDQCAWCAGEARCMRLDETYYADCGGVVFDLPCPASHVPGA